MPEATIATLTAQLAAAEKELAFVNNVVLQEWGDRAIAAEKVCEAAEQELHPWWDGADDLRQALTEWRRTKEGT